MVTVEKREGRRPLLTKWQRCVCTISVYPRVRERTPAVCWTCNVISNSRLSLAFGFHANVSPCGQEQNKVFGVGQWQAYDG